MQEESNKLEMGFLIKRETELKDLHNSQTGHIVKGTKNLKKKQKQKKKQKMLRREHQGYVKVTICI